jgi:hypothetical protein
MWWTPEGFGEVVCVLTQLGWKKQDDDFLVLDDDQRGFTQVRQTKKGQYLAEWRGPLASHRPGDALARAQLGRVRGKLLYRGRRGTDAFPIYAGEMLTICDALEILCAFWKQKHRPARFVWRDLSKFLAASQAARGAEKS